MTTGRRAKPTAIKRLESLDGRRERGGRLLRTDEIQPAVLVTTAKVPRPPKEMSARAKKTWKLIHESFANSGMLTPVDDLQLAIYCQLQAKFWDLQADGKWMSSPELAQLRQFSTMFGLDPSSRARPQFPGVRPNLTEPADDADALARLRARKQGTA